jgi:hypothetical protein
LLLMPAMLAILGMFLAWGLATAGQDARRQHDELKILYDQHYWKLELARAQLRNMPPEEIARIQKIVNKMMASQIISYARYGRQFTQWDGYRYEEIMDEGYAYHQAWQAEAERKDPQAMLDTGGKEKRTKNVVWYPLYPMLALGLKEYLGWLGGPSIFLGERGSAHALTAVSWTCCLLGAMMTFAYARRYYFARVARFPLPEGGGMLGRTAYDSAAMWVVVLLLFGPCSCFLYANFTESLFILLLTLFLYCLQARWWWRAALVAAFASASRSQGVLFGPILALVYLMQGTGGGLRALPKRLPRAALMGVISAAGLMGYMLLLQLEFGDPLAFMHAQRYWNVGLSLDRVWYVMDPTHAMAQVLRHVISVDEKLDLPRLWEAMCLLWPPIMLLVWGWRYLNLELSLVAWIMWGLPYVSNSMAGNPPMDSQWMSMGRFIGVSLPMFIILGAMFERRRWAGMLFVVPWVGVFGVFMFKFGAGAWVG